MNRQKKTNEELLSTFKPSMGFDSFTGSIGSKADKSLPYLTQRPFLNQNTDQEEYFKTLDNFFLEVDAPKATNPFLFSTRKTSLKQNKTKPASKFSTTFQSLSNSPEKKDTSPDRKEVKPIKPETSLDAKGDNNFSSDINLENTKGAFHKFLPKQDKSPSSPRTPIKRRHNIKPYSNKTP